MSLLSPLWIRRRRGGFTPNSIAGLFFQGEKGSLLATTFLSAPTSQTGSSSRDLLPRPMLTFNGTTQSMTVTGLSGSVTVVSKDGTSTPTVSAGSIAFTSGTIFNLLLSDGSFYPVVEGIGTTAFDTSVNAAHGTLINAPTWGTSAVAGFNPNNLLGYTNNAGVLVPARNATTDAQGNPLQFTGKALSRARIKNSNAIILNGTTQSGTVGAAGNVDRFRGWVKLTTDNQMLFSLANTAATAISVAAGVLTAGASLTLGTIRIGTTEANIATVTAAAAGVALNDNSFYFLEVNFTSINATALRYGLANTVFGAICLAGWQFSLAGVDAVNTPIAEGVGITSYDTSGNGRHIAWVNAPTWTTQNVFAHNWLRGFNKQMNFDGVNDRVDTPVTAITGNNLTVGGWFFVPAGTVNTFANNYFMTKTLVFALNFGHEIIEFRGFHVQIDNTYHGVGDLNLPAGVPFHFVGTYDGAAVRAYVNGVLAGTKNIAGTLTTSASPFRVSSWDGALFPLTGLASDTRAYNRTLSAAEIANWHSGLAVSTANNLFAYNGYGNANTDWLDTIGTNHGNVIGSPAVIRIPANGAVDAVGAVTRNLPIAGHNDAESVLDFKNTGVGGVAIAETAFMPASFLDIEFGENWSALDYAFRRARNSVVNDRHTIFPANLTGGNLTKMRAYVL